jgi:hypothetical protein
MPGLSFILAMLLLLAAPASARAVTFLQAVNVVLSFEGSALVENDAGKGPSRYGVLQAANTDITVATLSRERAIEIYRVRYWNAIHAGRLPDGVIRIIALDTAVQFGVLAATQMLASSGGDPVCLVQLRRQRHQDLIRANPAVYAGYRLAWRNRDDRLGLLAARELSRCTMCITAAALR